MVQYKKIYYFGFEKSNFVSSFSNLKHKELVVKREVNSEYFTSE